MCGMRSVWDSDLLSENPPHNPNYASRLSRIEIMAIKKDASTELRLTSN
jgi:hypothetical protein